jgi:hypothetical protein
MGYMFMMTKNQSVKQININNILNDFPIYWKRSQHIHGLKTIISIVRVPIIRTHNNVYVKKSFQNCFSSNQIHFSIKQIFAF